MENNSRRARRCLDKLKNKKVGALYQLAELLSILDRELKFEILEDVCSIMVKSGGMPPCVDKNSM